MTRAILLVEDDENDVLFMTMALKGVGLTCPIRVAIDGHEAQDYLSGAGKFADRHEYPLPYLVLLDLKLPRMPGLASASIVVVTGPAELPFSQAGQDSCQ